MQTLVQPWLLCDGGCVMTGIGEAIIQEVLAKTVMELLAEGRHPDDAAQQAIALLGKRVKSEGGCIVLDPRGRFGWAHNTSDMPCAVMTSGRPEPRVWLNKAEASQLRANRLEDEPCDQPTQPTGPGRHRSGPA